MKYAVAFLFCLTVICSCVAAASPQIAGIQVPVQLASAGQHRALAACVFCADVMGRNDLKKLCPDSVTAWNELVGCAGCSGGGACSDLCLTDWCAQLDNVAYVNASDACNNCIIAACWPELAACSSAM